MKDFDFARKVAEDIEEKIQRNLKQAGFDLSGLLNKLDPIRKIIYIAAMQLTVNALVAQMKEPEKFLFDRVVGHSETCVMSAAFDPRKKEE